MPRAIPLLVIVGLAVYSLFDVLQTSDARLRRLSKTTWSVLVLIPVVGAAAWFIFGRPPRAQQGPPRVIRLGSNRRPASPDDDPEFLRRLDEEAWRRKRDAAAAEERKRRESGPDDSGGAAPGGPGIAPAG